MVALDFLVDRTFTRVPGSLRGGRPPLAFAFVDLEKAFDLVPRDHLFAVLAEYGISTSVIETVRRMYTGVFG